MTADVRKTRQLDLGSRLRSLRSQRALTMEVVARRVGCSRAFLSRVERGQSLPSVPTLVGIAQALNVTVGYFFEPAEPERPIILRRADRGRTEGKGVVIEHLCRETATRRMHGLLYSLAPGVEFPARRQPRVDETCGLCLRGPVSLVTQTSRFELNTDDSFYLETSIPYRLVNSGPGEAQVLVVWTKRPM